MTGIRTFTIPSITAILVLNVAYGAEAPPCKGTACLKVSAEGWVVGEVRTFAFGTESRDLVKQLAKKGWVECAGQPADRDTFIPLAKLLRSTWGSGNGSTDFYLPDLRGMFLRGWNDGALAQAPHTLQGDPDAPKRESPRPEIQSPGTRGHTADAVGSSQHDQAQLNDHMHTFNSYHVQFERAAASPTEHFWGDNEIRKTGGVADDNPALHFETRPRNVYVLYMIYVGQDATTLIPK